MSKVQDPTKDASAAETSAANDSPEETAPELEAAETPETTEAIASEAEEASVDNGQDTEDTAASVEPDPETESVEESADVAQPDSGTASVESPADTADADVESEAVEQPADATETDTASEPVVESADTADTEAVEAPADATEPDADTEPVVESADATEPDAVAEAVEEPSDTAEPEPVDKTEDTAEADAETESVAESADTAEADSVTEPVDHTEDAADGETETDSIDEAADEEPSTIIGYTGTLTGDVITLAELQSKQQTHEEETLDSDRLQALIDESIPELSPQTIVAGTVAALSDRDVIVNVGFKSDGIVSRNEFGPKLEAGDEVEVFVERMENHWGQLVLSKVKADQVRRWQTIEKAYEEETVLEGVILRRIKGGMIVDLLDGLEAFLPGSQIDVRPIRDFDAYVDQRMEFKIVKINPANENVVISHKALIEQGLAEQRESILATMEKGQILEGKAKNITDFGVFVDLGGVDGLLHITDLSWGRVAHPTEVVQIDDDLKVVVLDYDRERRRISLGLKQLMPHPWEKVNEKYKKGDHAEGKVVSLTDYGAFVELERGIEGLVHISEMSWTDHIRHPSQKVSLGQVVKVGVLSIDNANKKIALGMKQFEVNPWDGLSQRTPPGTVLRGMVRHFKPYGAFVEIEPGVEGLVHITDLSWTKRPSHPSEILKKGHEVSVVVLDIDEGRRRISLGHKQIQTNPWANLSSVYAEGTDHQAKVTRIDARRLAVALPYDVEGIVPGSELKFRGDNIYANYTKGDMLDLRVIRIDPAKKEIVLSETAKEVQAARKARDERQRQKLAERKQQDRAVRQFKKKVRDATGPTTLGELSDLKAIHDRMLADERKEDSVSPAEADISAKVDESSEVDLSTTTDASAEAEVSATVEETAEADSSSEADTSAMTQESAEAASSAMADGSATADQSAEEETSATADASTTAEESVEVDTSSKTGKGTKAAKSTKADEGSGSDESAVVNESAKASTSTKTAKGTKASTGTKAKKTAKAAKSAKASTGTKAAKTSKADETAEDAKSAKASTSSNAAKSSKASTTTKSAKSTKASKSAKAAKSAESGKSAEAESSAEADQSAESES